MSNNNIFYKGVMYMNLSDEKFTELTKLKELDLMEQAKLDITIMMTCSRAKFANSLEKNL